MVYSESDQTLGRGGGWGRDLVCAQQPAKAKSAGPIEDTFNPNRTHGDFPSAPVKCVQALVFGINLFGGKGQPEHLTFLDWT